MSTTIRLTAPEEIEYPETDGEPMAENTLQYDWITRIKGNLECIFADDPNVFIAGDLFWYPVERDNTTRRTPRCAGGHWSPQGSAPILPPVARGWSRAPGGLRDSFTQQPRT